jgi:hypothetical protein
LPFPKVKRFRYKRAESQKLKAERQYSGKPKQNGPIRYTLKMYNNQGVRKFQRVAEEMDSKNARFVPGSENQ